MKQPLFYVARHGKTAGNEKNTYRGWSNGPNAQLTPEGRDDVRQAGLFFKAAGLQFPLVLSDDLDRTQETADIIADILGIHAHETDKRLRPLNVGDFTGKSKADHPLDAYMANPKLVIPGGESLEQFNARQQSVFDVILSLIIQIHKPILVVAHGSNVCYLHNHTNPGEKVGYEGLVNPGGTLMFTKDGIIPLTKDRKNATIPGKDGTPLSGFVTETENRPPRECWNCKKFVRIDNLGACTDVVVRIDPKLIDRRQADGTIAVGDRECCDRFMNQIGS